MAKFLRNKVDIIFWTVAIVLFALLVVYGAYAVKYLVNKFYEATNPNLIKPPEIVRFNLNKIQELRR